jgi:hypothetical protein
VIREREVLSEALHYYFQLLKTFKNLVLFIFEAE